MIKNYFKIAWRNLWKNKLFSFINIIGLAIGIVTAVLLLQFIKYELSYDAHTESIYRIQHDIYRNGVLDNSSAISYYGAAPAIKENFPEVTNFFRLHRADGMINYHSAKGEIISHHEEKSFYADSSFFSVFSFPLVEGDVHTVLRSPNSLVISESTSKKYFGTDNPIGNVK